MKDEKDFLQNEQPEQDTEKTETPVERERRKLTRRAVMVLVSGLIVVAVLVAVGIAWYTRIVNSYSVTFEVADYDLAINKNQEEIKLNVYDYAQVTNKKMAPGTVGWLPLEISAEYSQVDVGFTIAIENLMPDYIAKHFRIFALKKAELDENENLVLDENGKAKYSIYYGDVLTRASDMYAKIEGIPLYKKHYLDSKEDDTISDVMPKKTSKNLCIYWEWYLDADRARADHVKEDGTEDGFTFYYNNTEKEAWTELTQEQRTAAGILWDDLDTDIGRYPKKYAEALQIILYTTGAQSKPLNGVKPAEEESSNAF